MNALELVGKLTSVLVKLRAQERLAAMVAKPLEGWPKVQVIAFPKGPAGPEIAELEQVGVFFDSVQIADAPDPRNKVFEDGRVYCQRSSNFYVDLAAANQIPEGDFEGRIDCMVAGALERFGKLITTTEEPTPEAVLRA